MNTGIGFKNGTKLKSYENLLENMFVVILAMYPLRHVHMGVDLWDTGYSYANFAYMGLDHMDSMWLFSTYLANVVGNLLTKLPMADTLVGMNIYTGLFVSILALCGYFFCTGKLHIPGWIAFVGEMAAISLSWCPTAVLYNYLGYVLFLICVICLYQGLTGKKMRYLFIAGICLGANVLVRFSNLPQMAMILAVWVYVFVETHEEERNSSVKSKFSGNMKTLLRYTLWCLGGYLTALVVLFGYIHIRYGLDAYVEGILRLFDMTETATDYKATSMIMGIVRTYAENSYWMIRLGLIAAAGVLLGVLLSALTEYCSGVQKHKRLCGCLRIGWKIVCVVLALGSIGWLYYSEFFSFLYYSYDSMILPGILFLMLTMIIAGIRIFHKNSPKEEKLISGMLILVILLTSLGSNNGVYPSINNLYVAAPYTMWQCFRFAKRKGIYVIPRTIGGKRFSIDILPVKGVAAAFLLVFLVQSVLFGAKFVFAESTGLQNMTATVTDNDVLAGVKMPEERAEWLQEISEYVREQHLKGREVILYGDLPALSFYLQMPSAFNPWSDLTSYSIQTMKRDMEELREEVLQGVQEAPVVIVECAYGAEEPSEAIVEDVKWQLIVEFMKEFGYTQTFENEKFVIYEK